jgi:hypothetical protein
MKSENFFKIAVIVGISTTDELSVSNIPGNTKPNKYIIAAIEITINTAG